MVPCAVRTTTWQEGYAVRTLSSSSSPDIPGIIRDKILEIGYDSSAKGYDGASCGVSVSIGSQSPDIAQGVNDAFEYREGEGTEDFDRQGAGDQEP